MAKGDSFVLADLETTITKADFRGSVSSEFFHYKPDSDSKLLIVNYTVKNNGREPVSCLSFADSAIDEEGTRYDDTLDCNIAINNWALEKLNPKKKKSFQACFEVPKSAKGLKVLFDCHFEHALFDTGL